METRNTSDDLLKVKNTLRSKITDRPLGHLYSLIPWGIKDHEFNEIYWETKQAVRVSGHLAEANLLYWVCHYGKAKEFALVKESGI